MEDEKQKEKKKHHLMLQCSKKSGYIRETDRRIATANNNSFNK